MNQMFKKKVIVASLAAAFAVGAGFATANEFEASNVLNYASTNKETLVIGGAAQRIMNFHVVESGIWQGGATAVVSAVTAKLQNGLHLMGPAMEVGGGAKTDADAKVKTALTDLTALATVGTTYDIVHGMKGVAADVDSGAAGVEGIAFLMIKDLGTVGDYYAIAGAVNTEAGNAATAYRFASLKAAATNDAVGANAVVGITTLNAEDVHAENVILITSAGAATTDAVETIGKFRVNSDGTTEVSFYVESNDATTSTDDYIELPDFFVKAATGAATGSMSITLKDGDLSGANILGITETTVAVATATNNVVAVSGPTTTPAYPDILVGTLTPQKIGEVNFKFATADANVNDAKITVTLDKGAKFKSGASDLASVYSETTDGGADTDIVASVDSSGNLVLTFDAADTIADGDGFKLVANKAVIDASGITSTGAITATITATSGIENFGSQTLVVANAISAGTTISLVDDATAGVPTLFTGRDTLTINESVKLVESAPGALVQYGSMIITASNGAKFDNAAGTITSDNTTMIDAISDPSTSAATVQGSIKATSSSASTITLGSFAFDLSSATAGDLNLSFSGTSNATGSIKVATLVDATSMSVSGTMPTMTKSSASVALPTIVITEGKYGALDLGTNAKQIALVLPTGMSFDSTAAVTVTVKEANGTASTNWTTSETTKVYWDSNQAFAFYAAATSEISNSTSGAYTIEVSGLKANASSSATAGDVKLTIIGTDNDAVISDELTATNKSDVGAKPTYQLVKVATMVGDTMATIPAATVTGVNTAQTISTSIVPAGNDQGKQGSTFLILHAPNGKFGLTADYYFTMSSAGTFKLMTSCSDAVAYSEGTLASTTMPVVSTAADLSSLVGLKIIVGYGVGGGLTSGSSTACTSMMNNGTWGVAYTIQ